MRRYCSRVDRVVEWHTNGACPECGSYDSDSHAEVDEDLGREPQEEKRDD